MERSVGFFLASEKSFKAFISVLFCSELAAASPTSPWAPLQMASVRGCWALQELLCLRFELLPGGTACARHVGVARACHRSSAGLSSLFRSLIPRELFSKPAVFQLFCSSRSCGFASQKVTVLVALPRYHFPLSFLIIPAWLRASSWPKRY